MDFIILTKKLIERGMTANVGINNNQLKVFGFSKRNCTKWKQKLIGRRVLVSDYEKFLSFKKEIIYSELDAQLDLAIKKD